MKQYRFNIKYLDAKTLGCGIIRLKKKRLFFTI